VREGRERGTGKREEKGEGKTFKDPLDLLPPPGENFLATPLCGYNVKVFVGESNEDFIF